MDYRTLPGSTLQVSAICLGTMTFGQQNTQAEGHAQLDFAIERGVNFIDTAEMYPVPPRRPSGTSASKPMCAPARRRRSSSSAA